MRDLLLQTVIFFHQQLVHGTQLSIHRLKSGSFLSLLFTTSVIKEKSKTSSEDCSSSKDIFSQTEYKIKWIKHNVVSVRTSDNISDIQKLNNCILPLLQFLRPLKYLMTVKKKKNQFRICKKIRQDLPQDLCKDRPRKV